MAIVRTTVVAAFAVLVALNIFRLLTDQNRVLEEHTLLIAQALHNARCKKSREHCARKRLFWVLIEKRHYDCHNALSRCNVVQFDPYAIAIKFNTVAFVFLALAITFALAHLRFVLNQNVDVFRVETARTIALANQRTLCATFQNANICSDPQNVNWVSRAVVHTNIVSVQDACQITIVIPYFGFFDISAQFQHFFAIFGHVRRLRTVVARSGISNARGKTSIDFLAASLCGAVTRATFGTRALASALVRQCAVERIVATANLHLDVSLVVCIEREEYNFAIGFSDALRSMVERQNLGNKRKKLHKDERRR